MATHRGTLLELVARGKKDAFFTANPKTAFFQRLGFSLDGRHRSTHWTEGAWHDSLYFSLLASDVRPSYPT